MLLTEFDEKAYLDGVKKQSYEEGEARGEIKGEEKLARLVVELKKRGRVEDIAKVTDEGERERLYREFNIWGFNIVQSSEYAYTIYCNIDTIQTINITIKQLNDKFKNNKK